MHTQSVSRDVHARLVEQLVDLEENQVKIVNELFPLPCREKEEFDQLLKNYTDRLDQLVRQKTFSDEHNDLLPFVTLDSIVQVQSLNNGVNFTWNIVLPLNCKLGRGSVSCLSPVGRSLLMKNIGDTVTVNAPNGIARYKILSINLRLKSA